MKFGQLNRVHDRYEVSKVWYKFHDVEADLYWDADVGRWIDTPVTCACEKLINSQYKVDHMNYFNFGLIYSVIS